MEDCRDQGALPFTPPTPLAVEYEGLGVLDGEQVEAKRCYEPLGLLNPGKLRGWQPQFADSRGS